MPTEVLAPNSTSGNNYCQQKLFTENAANAQEAVSFDQTPGPSGLCSREQTPYVMQNVEMWMTYYYYRQHQHIDAWYAGMFNMYGTYRTGPMLMGPTLSVPYPHFEATSYPY